MREQESRIPRLGVAQKHTHNVTLRLLYRVGRRGLLLVAYFSYMAAEAHSWSILRQTSYCMLLQAIFSNCLNLPEKKLSNSKPVDSSRPHVEIAIRWFQVTNRAQYLEYPGFRRCDAARSQRCSLKWPNTLQQPNRRQSS